MAKKKKYQWEIGGRLPKIDQHTLVKHRLVNEYVSEYIARLMSNASMPRFTVSLVDGFCGGGWYEDETGSVVAGSPLQMLDAVRAQRALLNLHRKTPRIVDANFHFVDVDPDATRFLKFVLNAERDAGRIEHSDFSQIDICTADFEVAYPGIKANIQQRRAGGHAIFVLDQFNYSDVAMSQLRAILEDIPNAEIILTFNVGSLTTYLSNHARNRRAVESIGLDKYIPWEHLAHLKAENSEHGRRIIQSCCAEGIRDSTGARFCTLFFVRPYGSNPWDYWLVHLSGHYRAHDVMKSLHWRHATCFGHELAPGVFQFGYDANNDESYHQSGFVFGTADRQLCIDGVHERFGQEIFARDQEIRVGDLFQQFISQTPGAEEHLQTSIFHLHAEKSIVVVGKDGRIREPSKKYHHDDVLAASRTLRMSFD